MCPLLRRFLLACGLAALGLAGHATALATTVYQCVGADGRPIFQDRPCRTDQHQRVVELPDVPSMTPASLHLPAPSPSTSAGPVPPPTPDLPPAAPLPLMYACTRATDGKTYLSQNGNPAPYQAPYGVLGAEQQPLSEVYGADRGAAGISAPEANRGRITSGMVAGNHVWVQDRCRELDAAETCQALRQAYDENEHQLHNAFKSQRPPLEKREAQLQAQLASCGD